MRLPLELGRLAWTAKILIYGETSSRNGLAGEVSLVAPRVLQLELVCCWVRGSERKLRSPRMKAKRTMTSARLSRDPFLILPVLDTFFFLGHPTAALLPLV